jgi:hypothetical protein
MSRRSPRRGRPYQPLPARHIKWGARLTVVIVAFILVIGFAILAFAR